MVERVRGRKRREAVGSARETKTRQCNRKSRERERERGAIAKVLLPKIYT